MTNKGNVHNLHKMKIAELSENGVILTMDEQGYLVKQASPEKIQKTWWPPLQMTIDAYLTSFGSTLHTVYVRGSVPLGRAREYLSDIDTFALVDHPSEHIDLQWGKAHSRDVNLQFPYVTKVEVLAFPTTFVGKHRDLAALIKTQSACVYGTDISSQVEGLVPGIEMMLHSWELPYNLANANRVLEVSENPGTIQKVCEWIMKRIIRCGFELVMERAECYTRDLFPCYRFFANYYPEKAALMSEALLLTIYPSNEKDKIKVIVHELGNWLYREICMECGAERIGQILSVKNSGA